MSQPAEAQKSQIRARIRRLRRQINPDLALAAGNRVRQLLLQHPVYADSNKIACFSSIDGEIDTQPIISQLMKDKGCCFLPKIRPNKPNRLWFMPFDGRQPLRSNHLGIPEVDLPVNFAERVSSLDIILLPLVAFDLSGNRLGMGGGYYDATFSHLRDCVAGRERPLMFGVAFEQQRVEQVPVAEWDLPLDGVFSDLRFYAFNSVIKSNQVKTSQF